MMAFSHGMPERKYNMSLIRFVFLDLEMLCEGSYVVVRRWQWYKLLCIKLSKSCGTGCPKCTSFTYTPAFLSLCDYHVQIFY
jgi:hypothetical protein